MARPGCDVHSREAGNFTFLLVLLAQQMASLLRLVVASTAEDNLPQTSCDQHTTEGITPIHISISYRVVRLEPSSRSSASIEMA